MSLSKQTIVDFIDGDQEATSRVYLEYKNLLYFIIASYVDNKDDCNDVLSEVFIKAIQNRQSLLNKESLKTYLCSIAKNEAINFMKKNRNIPCEIIDEIYGENDRHNSVLEMLEPLLTSKETIVIYYKAVFSYTWEEISKETGIPSSTARLIYKVAKEKLRKELK